VPVRLLFVNSAALRSAGSRRLRQVFGNRQDAVNRRIRQGADRCRAKWSRPDKVPHGNQSCPPLRHRWGSHGSTRPGHLLKHSAEACAPDRCHPSMLQRPRQLTLEIWRPPACILLASLDRIHQNPSPAGNTSSAQLFPVGHPIFGRNTNR